MNFFNSVVTIGSLSNGCHRCDPSEPGLIEGDETSTSTASFKRKQERESSDELDEPIPKKKKTFARGNLLRNVLRRAKTLKETQSIGEDLITEYEAACAYNYRLVATNDLFQETNDESLSECAELRQNLRRAESEAARWKGKHDAVQQRNVA